MAPRNFRSASTELGSNSEDTVNSVNKGSDAILADRVSQEIDCHLAYDTHVTVKYQRIFCQYLEHMHEISSMLFLVVRCNE